MSFRSEAFFWRFIILEKSLNQNSWKMWAQFRLIGSFASSNIFTSVQLIHSYCDCATIRMDPLILELYSIWLPVQIGRNAKIFFVDPTDPLFPSASESRLDVLPFYHRLTAKDRWELTVMQLVRLKRSSNGNLSTVVFPFYWHSNTVVAVRKKNKTNRKCLSHTDFDHVCVFDENRKKEN